MSGLSEFRELVNEISDPELLNVAESLLDDMVKIQIMKERIEMLEETLSKGDRAAFWFFAMGLDKEQVDLARNTVLGRRSYLLEKNKKLREAKEDEGSSKGDSV